ncbi:MAG: GerAB/ArcD/ProY family transporter [Firmicutes bacterium]|nr:GerAB/ArcD/ProY family transporter [Bacillota bacterium]
MTTRAGRMPERPPGHPGTRLSYREATALLTIYIGSKAFTSCPSQLIYLVGTSAWITAIIAYVPAVLGMLANYHFAVRFGGLSYQRCVEATVGKAAGKLLGLVFFLILLGMNAISLREFAGAYKTSILPMTPLPVLGWLGAFTAVWGSMFGIEAIGRAASMMFAPLALLSLTILLSALLLEFSVAEVFPLWGTGASHTIWGSAPCSSLYAEGFAVGLLVPYLRSAETTGRRLCTVSLLISAGYIAAAVFFTEVLFTAPVGAQMLYPMLQLASAIQLGAFFERIESLFVFAWIFFASVKVALGNLLASVLLTDILGVRRWSFIIWPVAILTYFGAFAPDTLVDVFILQITLFRSVGWIVAWVFPALLLAIAATRRLPGRERRDREPAGGDGAE